ncbi:transposase family protein [Streptomyces violascens]|uniref:transposase family protein n=1 Tax=Streptomyces violascens TaxID=67381 RepID=UPI0037BD43BA
MARGRAAGAACPDCDSFSHRVHDSCQRRLKDLPLSGQSVVIWLTDRRFICGSQDRPRRTFAEPFAQLTAPYGSTPSMPASCPASPASHSSCCMTSMRWPPGSPWSGVLAAPRAP